MRRDVKPYDPTASKRAHRVRIQHVLQRVIGCGNTSVVHENVNGSQPQRLYGQAGLSYALGVIYTECNDGQSLHRGSNIRMQLDAAGRAKGCEPNLSRVDSLQSGQARSILWLSTSRDYTVCALQEFFRLCRPARAASISGSVQVLLHQQAVTRQLRGHTSCKPIPRDAPVMRTLPLKPVALAAW